MRNKFNYNTREAQTINSTVRDKGVSTEPPPSDTIRGNITQWEIFDAYMQDIDKEAQEKKKKDQEFGDKKQESTLYSNSFRRCLKIMERMVVQNDQNEKYYDYKYYWSQVSFVIVLVVLVLGCL
jgi:dynein intermediate chain 1